MYDAHRFIGEGLFIIYLFVMLVVVLVGRGGRPVPAAISAIAHGLLAIQVALGVILLAEDPDRVVWYHAVLGIAALLALALTPVLRSRLGQTSGLVVTLAIVAVLTLAARLAVLG